MLPGPWKSLRPTEAGREYLALISYLPLQRYRKIPPWCSFHGRYSGSSGLLRG
jgi:hypothetical protein